jgi:hypothetical protein
MADYYFKSVREFTYLGAYITNENKVEEKITKRIMSGNRAYFSHMQLFKSNISSKKTKIKLYKTLVRPVTWTLKTTDENSLTLRKYGPIYIK